MKKKIIALILSLSFIVMLCSCKDKVYYSKVKIENVGTYAAVEDTPLITLVDTYKYNFYDICNHLSEYKFTSKKEVYNQLKEQKITKAEFSEITYIDKNDFDKITKYISKINYERDHYYDDCDYYGRDEYSWRECYGGILRCEYCRNLKNDEVLSIAAKEASGMITICLEYPYGTEEITVEKSKVALYK